MHSGDTPQHAKEEKEEELTAAHQGGELSSRGLCTAASDYSLANRAGILGLMDTESHKMDGDAPHSPHRNHPGFYS